MSAEITAAVKRAADEVYDRHSDREAEDVAYNALDAALDVEEMARAMCPHSHCDGSKRSCPDHPVNVERAKRIRTALLGADS